MAMPSIILTQSGVGSSTVFVPDFFKDVFNVGLQAVVTGTVGSYSIQFTLDDTTADTFVPANATWTAVTNMSAISASATTNLTIPCRGIRINVGTGPGSVALTIQQAGTR